MGQRLQQPARFFGLGELRGQLVEAAHVTRPAGADDFVTPVQCLHMQPQIEKPLTQNCGQRLKQEGNANNEPISAIAAML